MVFNKGDNIGHRQYDGDGYTPLSYKKILKKKGINPFEELLKLIPDLSPPERARGWAVILQYISNKPRMADVASSTPIKGNKLKGLSTDTIIKNLMRKDEQAKINGDAGQVDRGVMGAGSGEVAVKAVPVDDVRGDSEVPGQQVLEVCDKLVSEVR